MSAGVAGKAEGKGNRDEDRHAVRGAEARQRANDGSEKTAEQRQRHVLPGDGDGKAVGEMRRANP